MLDYERFVIVFLRPNTSLTEVSSVSRRVCRVFIYYSTSLTLSLSESREELNDFISEDEVLAADD